MGVEYYFYAPKENVIYDVDKWENWEHFKPFLTSKHDEWVLIDDNHYNWWLVNDMLGEDGQEYTHEFENDIGKVSINYVIPNTTTQIDCFDEPFQMQFKQWKVREEERRMKHERWQKEDAEFNALSHEEKQQYLKDIMKVMREL